MSPRQGTPSRRPDPVPVRLSRHQKPEGLSVEEWQAGLRRQFGAEQPFVLANVGDEKVFSDYTVTNPQSGRTYRVAIRGSEPGVNYCSCPDFATNALGTCKHVAFTLAALGRRRGGTQALARGFRPSYSSLSLVHGPRRYVRLRLAGGAPAGLRRLARRHFDRDGFLLPGSFGVFTSFLDAAARYAHELRCYEDAARYVAEVTEAAQRRAILEKAFPSGPASAAFEGLLATPLPAYQREGALFCALTGRAILADEMGLGKTVQAIAAAEIAARYLGVTRVLVVCPASLKHQWQDEIGRFCTRSVEVVSGTRPAREKGFARPSFWKVTGYDSIHADLDLVATFAPQLVVLDEAQRIKNWSTRVARSVKRIESPMALVLTGTPLENRLEELISIVQFVDQHRLGPTWRVLHEHQVFEPGTTRVVGYRDLDRLGETLAPVLLRRRKAEVLAQLPPRTDTRLTVGMTPEQRQHHDENAEIVARLVAKWRRFRRLSEADQKRLTIALQRMRMSCDSTYLLDGETDFGPKADEVAALLEDVLAEEGTKVVVFSQWLRMHELLVRRIAEKGWGFALLHGGVPSTQRGALVRRFRKDPSCRLFLSTDAGGTGLNLQAASAVVNVDQPWNPAVLEQRIGRVHRLGQERPVQVFDLVAEKTIEEGILSLLGFKRALAAGVLDGGAKDVALGGTRLSKFMESVEAVVEATPRPVLELPAPALAAAEEEAPDPAVEVAEPAGESATRALAAATAAVAADIADAVAAAPPEQGEGALAAPPRPASPDDAVATLLSAGALLLSQLAEGARAKAATTGEPAAPVSVRRDPATGETSVSLRLPPGVLEALAAGLAQLLGR